VSRPPSRRAPTFGYALDPDLAEALAVLRRAGLQPEVRGVRPNRPVRRRRPPIRYDWAAAIRASGTHTPRRPAP